MPQTPEEDALIDSFEEEHPEDQTSEAEAAPTIDTPPATRPKKKATPKNTGASLDNLTSPDTSENPNESEALNTPNTPDTPDSSAASETPLEQEKEEVEEVQGTETVEMLPVSKEPTGNLTSLQTLPFEVSVEVSRLEMKFKELSELRPGNLLELPTRPENGVYLVANGKKLARGELIRVGQLLGIRILEIEK